MSEPAATGFDPQDNSKQARAYRSAHRRDPLPPNSWIVEHDKTYKVLRVSGPGVADLWSGSGQPAPLTVASIKPGWWRRWQLHVTDQAGVTLKLGAAPFGDAGVADAGRPTSDGASFLASLGNDPISAVILVVAVLLFVVTGPMWYRRRLRRLANAKAIRGALQC